MLEDIQPEYQFMAFCGSESVPAAGNLCVLRLGSDDGKLLERNIKDTLCITSNTLNSEDISVSCYVGGQAIQCCGHGLLSAAFYWMDRENCSEINLQMHSSQIRAFSESELIWLEFPLVQLNECEIPDWVEQVFGVSPVRAAKMGADDSYYVLEWAKGFDLKSLPIPDNTLGRLTRRALICTAESNVEEVDIFTRYFAPQYGVLEDRATGSAMRVLACYWGKPNLKALQLSMLEQNSDEQNPNEQSSHVKNMFGIDPVNCQTGLLSARLRPDRVTVGGIVKRVS